MIKKIFFQILSGASIFIIGVCLHDFLHWGMFGDLIAYFGIAYLIIAPILTLKKTSISLIIKKNGGSKLLSKTKNYTQSKIAKSKILEYKKLLDEGIITQDEYDSKSKELKKLFL